MTMKLLFKYTSSLLRTALLIGALALFNIPTTQAQPVSITAEMPDPFETIATPTIGQGDYYFIQFYQELGNSPYLIQSFLGELGEGVQMQAMDYMPFAGNRLWTLVPGSDADHFKLKSKRGYYVYYYNNRFYTTLTEANASEFVYRNRGNYRNGYKNLQTTIDTGNGETENEIIFRWSNGEWAQIIKSKSLGDACYVRFAKLKPNAAHIIYYRSEGLNNSDPQALTTRRYLTYSGTGNESPTRDGWFRESSVSSRLSIIPSDKSLWTLPTAAAYHKDGLWVLEETSTDGEFYIKKYGSEQYLNPVKKRDGSNNEDWFYCCELGTQNETGIYKLETPIDNRYTRIQNAGLYDRAGLTSNQFFNWSTNYPGANKTDENPAYVDFNINQELNAGATVVGTGNVWYLTYADLTGSAKMVIEGTSGVQLRVLLNRLEVGNGGGDGNGGALTERLITIGNDNKAELDLTDLDYIHLNAIKFASGSPTGMISSISLLTLTPRYFQHGQGTGWPVYQWAGGHTDDWYAGFYPVEVPASGKDEFFQVKLVLNEEGSQSINLANGRTNSGDDLITNIEYLSGSNASNIVGAKFTPTNDFQRCFRFQNFATNGYNTIVIKFAEPVVGNWNISGIVNGNQTWESIPEGSTWYEMDLRDVNGNVYSSISDFTIFNWEGERHSISIAEVYFHKGTMVGLNGCSVPSSDNDPVLWQLEQETDYQIFRLKNENGGYLNGNCLTTSDANNSNAIYSNERLTDDFYLRWYIPKKKKEIVVSHYVRHKESYLRAYADDLVITDQAGLKKQGLATDIDSDWWNNDGNGFADQYSKKGTQNTNHFVITHYVKMAESKVIEFPTVLNWNNDHIYYQRFYNYDELDTGAGGNGMDLGKLKAHVSLGTGNNDDVQYFLYKNGMVTGQKLDWTGIDAGDYARNVQRRFTFTNSDGLPFTVGVDVSRYSDLEYLDNGDLREPSLTMRYLFQMRDAKEMATNLTACTYGSNKWLEEKEIHFGRTQVPYTKFKKVGYRGEFIGLRHLFSDYWVFDGNGTGNDNLVSAVNDNNSGKIEVVIYDPHNTGIRLGGYNPVLGQEGLNGYGADGNDADYQGFYFYDLLSPSPKHEYGNSRFVVFRYPAEEDGIVQVKNCGSRNPAYVRVYLNNGGTRYQLAQFTLFFDANMATRPWTEIKNGTHYANGKDWVKGFERDPNELRKIAGEPRAKITFDFPKTMNIPDGKATYHFPPVGVTLHDKGTFNAGGTIANSSPVPLTFGKTNYAFDGDNCNWGSYAIVTEKTTVHGNQKIVKPADDNDYGYGIDADPGMQKAFLYIDASEQPGDICAVEFDGSFCADDQLMCTGWISGSNKIQNDTRCPGSITLTVKGEDSNGDTQTIYRFCPGQIYELDNGYVSTEDGSTNVTEGAAGIDGSGNGADHVVWQQFFFEFSTDKKYERYWLEVNNNCVSSNGGDFMLDNIEVYTIVPEVDPEINTPLCIKKDGDNLIYDMRFLKLKVDFNSLLSSIKKQESSTSQQTQTPYIGFVFLEKETFLKKLMQELGLTDVSLETMAKRVESGYYDNTINGGTQAYQKAFDKALLRVNNSTAIWKSDAPSTNMGAGVLYFQWDKTFNNMEAYSFSKAINKTHATYRATEGGVDYIILNGNYPQLPWKINTEYYIVPSNTYITSFNLVYDAFNICSNCSKACVFQIDPPYHVLGLESSETTNDYIVCEGQIPTILLDLKGFTLDGKEVDLNDLNFDWWLGNATTLATLENYHKQNNGNGIKLDKALSTFRTYYTEATSLDGLRHEVQHTPDPALTVEMIDYLQELVDAGELVLHQKSVSVPAEKASNEDPYFYLVACPIHDGYFDKALNPTKNEYVTYFCDEPQGLRIKVGQKAPTLKSGFVPGERGFSTYDYTFPAGTDPVLSIRLAKAAQFETVKNTAAEGSSASASVNHLWLPIRNAETESAGRVIKKSQDDNIYLASTNDPTWDKNIYTAMSEGSLPVVGRIVELNAINTKGGINLDNQNTNNLLRIYFTKDFEVREGYNYTLSLPFQEDQNVNSCDGTILINLKIVPDYEVWTGAAGNTDWNNDENWRRADGNTEDHSGLNDDELYVSAATSTSPLSGYKTNKWNYRTAKDRVFRKGFAPLYCTHVLMKSDEWGDAPVLYDAIDGKPLNNQTNSRLVNLPFPNLRETSTPILKFDMQARKYNMWNETYGTNPDRGSDSRPNDLIAEMYQINSCDEIAMQPGTELRDAHLLNYNTAWVEYQIDNKRWYLLGSPLQGTISGEWYAPKSTAQQKTTYYDPVSFGTGYDRYNPAIYQRSWDKAKAVLYEIGSSYATTDDSQTGNLGTGNEGKWSNNTSTAEWQVEGGGTADEYLDRLGYKPMGGNKANVAIQGIWSNTYNDATVDYANGGFSVMVMNHLKGTANDQSNDVTIVRLPKEDTMYDYYQFSQTGANDGGTDTELSVVRNAKDRAKNRGRLKTDLLLPTSTNKTEKADSRYGDKRTYTRVPIKEGDLNTMLTGIRNHEETISAGVSNLGYYLVENPFPCGLNMDKFFAGNKKLLPKYWILTATGKQHLVQKVDDEWISSTSDGFATADGVAVPGQGFFVEADPSFTDSDMAYTDGVGQTTTITFTKDMQAQSRYGEQSGTGKTYNIVVGTKQKMTTTTETITMDDGSTQTVTVEVPETDASGNYVLEDLTEDVVVYNYEQTTETDKQYKLKTRGETVEALLSGMVITAEREDFESSALVMQRGTASNDFLPEEDTETFITSDLQHVPTVYTLCGRLATTINSIHDFRSLSLGVESNSDAPCTLTFKGVEMLGDSIAFYDAVEKTLTPLESGMQVSVSGQTQNRYYLVRGLNLKEAAEETHLQIFTEGLTAKVIASTAEPILVVRCFDTSGRLLYTANPDSAEHSFTLPDKGIYIIEAQTENDRKTIKVMTK